MVMQSWYETHSKGMYAPRRNKRKRVNDLDPNGDKKDKLYTENYGL